MVRGAKIVATIPSSLEYRDLAVRLVASSCKFVRRGRESFSNEVISAFSEALNNIVIHGGSRAGAVVQIEIDPRDDGITIRLTDAGRSFDPLEAPVPDLESLPESGLGAFIMRSFMDEIAYTGGPPNTLTMKKFVRGDDQT